MSVQPTIQGGQIPPPATKVETVRLTIDGQEIVVPKGTMLIAAAKGVGADIPHFCYHPKLISDANCRMCLVEIEKMPKLQTSCSTPVAEGMVVKTSSPRVIEGRQGVMEFLLGNHPLDCPDCDEGGACQLQDFGHQYSPMGSRFAEGKRAFEKEYFGPLIEKEMNRCISCLRCVRYCDEVMDVNALGSIDRGTVTQIGGFAHRELDCEFCGGCIQICPTGALTSRLSMFDYRPWQVKKTETICGYCGDGCTLTLETIKEKVVRVSSEMGVGRNDGDLCPRGYFGYGFTNHPKRLARPKVRKSVDQPFSDVPWEFALNEAARRILDIRQRYGPGAIAGIASARLTNEDLYVFQRLMRALGTNHIDSSARFGRINAVRALQRVFGTTRVGRYEEILQADLILSIAGDMAQSNPIVALKVKEAVKRRGAKLIAIDPYSDLSDPYRSHIPRLAANSPGSLHVGIHPFSEGSAILGLVKALARESGGGAFSSALARATDRISWPQIEAATGVNADLFRRIAGLLCSAQRAVLLFGRSITDSASGYRETMNLLDALLLSAEGGSRKWRAIIPLADENNEQGALEMGVAPEYLPGLIPSPAGGYRLLEIFRAAARGEIKALYLLGENVVESLPSSIVRPALEKLELLIVHELFPTATAEAAQIVFPAASYAEKDGTFTNQEGIVQKVRKAIDPIEMSRPDWEILSRLSVKLGLPLSYRSSAEITMEWRSLMPGTDGDALARATSYMEGGFSEDVEGRYSAPGRIEPKNGHFDLIVGPALFHSGRLSTYAEGLLLLQKEGALLLNPEDAERLGIPQGGEVRVTNLKGDRSKTLFAKPSAKLAAGMAFYPEHFGIIDLFDVAVDPATGVPSFKRGRVSLEAVTVGGK